MQPAFSKNNIPIAFATDTNYFWALMVALESLQVNSSNEYNYDIIVLEALGGGLTWGSIIIKW